LFRGPLYNGPLEDLQLWNRVSALVAGERLGAAYSEGLRQAEPEPYHSTRRKA